MIALVERRLRRLALAFKGELHRGFRPILLTMERVSSRPRRNLLIVTPSLSSQQFQGPLTGRSGQLLPVQINWNAPLRAPSTRASRLIGLRSSSLVQRQNERER